MNLVSFNSATGCKEPFTISSDVDRKIEVEIPGSPDNLILDLIGVKEITKILTRADVGGDLDGEFFKIYDKDGSVGVWIDVDDSGTTIPFGAAACDRAIEITTIVTGGTSTANAIAIAAILNADPEFSVPVPTTGEMFITDAVAGFRINASAEDSGFTITEDTKGVNPVEVVSEPLGKIRVTLVPEQSNLVRSGSVIVRHDEFGDGVCISTGVAGGVIVKESVPNC